MTLQEQVYELLGYGGVLIGSRALNVDDKESDYDIAIKRRDLPKQYNKCQLFDPSCYFSVLPLHNSSLIREQDLDILVYDNGHDFNAIKTAIEITKKIPVELLKDKSFRVIAFENALKLTGNFK